MLYTPLTKKALKICFEAHKDQVDKSGLPYVFHPFHLAERLRDEETVTAALLHDVVEDGHSTFEDLGREGIPESVLCALRLLTHDPSVPYLTYIEALKGNRIARAVKIEDLRHNLDATRLDAPDAKYREKAKLYRKALRILTQKNKA